MAGDPGKADAATKCSVQQWRHAFLLMLQDILNDMELDPKPFNTEFFLKVKKNLLIELSAKNQPGINTERERAPAKIAKFTRSSTGKGINPRLATLEKKIALREQAPTKIAHSTRSSTGQGINPRLGKLEEKIALLEAPNGHLHTRKPPQGQGGYNGDVCLICNSTEHPTHKCSKANKQAVLAYEKAQQAKGRNQALSPILSRLLTTANQLSVPHCPSHLVR